MGQLHSPSQLGLRLLSPCRGPRVGGGTHGRGPALRRLNTSAAGDGGMRLPARMEPCFPRPGSRQRPAADQEGRTDPGQPQDLRASGAAGCPWPAAPCRTWWGAVGPGLVPQPRQRCQGTQHGDTTLGPGCGMPRSPGTHSPARHEAGAAEQEGSQQCHGQWPSPWLAAGHQVPCQERAGAARLRRLAPAGSAMHREY